MQDVEAVNFFDAGFGNAATQRFGTDFIEQRLAPGGGELYGVGQTGNRVQVVEDDGSGHHRPGQRTPARLIHSSDQARWVPLQAVLFRQ